MDQDHEAKSKREEQTPTRDAANPAKPKPDQIDPERLRKAIRYLKEHPAERVRKRADVARKKRQPR